MRSFNCVTNESLAPVEVLDEVEGSYGYVIEFFDLAGSTVGVQMVDADNLGPLGEHSMMQARAFEAIARL